jgi:hypothetical protein
MDLIFLHLQLNVKGLDNDSDAAIMMSDNTAKLTSAVNTLPQLLEKKRLIDMHTTIATGAKLNDKFRVFLTYKMLISYTQSHQGEKTGFIF